MNHVSMKHPVTHISTSDGQVAVGPLEREVMEVLWNAGARNVWEVVIRLHRQLAYTTVKTTLDRLYKKGLVSRFASEHAFMYSPNLTRQESNRRLAREMMAGFLSGPEESRQMLVSCLMDAVSSDDSQFLDELENEIQRKRKELASAKQKLQM